MTGTLDHDATTVAIPAARRSEPRADPTAGRAADTHLAVRRLAAFWPLTGATVATAAAARLWDLSTRPGFEWDEPVYTSVGSKLLNLGDLSAKTEYLSPVEPYLYHPPFYFWLLRAWFGVFGAGIAQSRLLAALASVIALVLVAMFIRRVAGPTTSLVATALLAFDGWAIFTNRISWLENTMMPLGILALWATYEASKRHSTRFYVLAGVLLGFVSVYKQVGVYFALAALLFFLLHRIDRRQHLWLALTYLATIGTYLAVMSGLYGQTYWRESLVQFTRSLNLRESRGALDSIADIVDPLIGQYKIFVLSLIIVVIALALTLRRVVQMVRQRSTMGHDELTLLYAWAGAAFLFFAALQLRLPHYFIMVLTPALCLVAAEGTRWASSRLTYTHQARTGERRARRRVLAGVLLAGLVIGSVDAAVYYDRFASREDNALNSTVRWMDANVNLNAKVVTEESVGTIIQQPYCKIFRAERCHGAQYLITYESITQHPPASPAMARMIASGTRLTEFSGFKEHIVVYKLPRPLP